MTSSIWNRSDKGSGREDASPLSALSSIPRRLNRRKVKPASFLRTSQDIDQKSVRTSGGGEKKRDTVPFRSHCSLGEGREERCGDDGEPAAPIKEI